MNKENHKNTIRNNQVIDDLPNFFKRSSVDYFYEHLSKLINYNGANSEENINIDYDGSSYIRMMKYFKIDSNKLENNELAKVELDNNFYIPTLHKVKITSLYNSKIEKIRKKVSLSSDEIEFRKCFISLKKINKTFSAKLDNLLSEFEKKPSSIKNADFLMQINLEIEESARKYLSDKIKNVEEVDIVNKLDKGFHLRFYLPKQIISTIDQKIDEVVILLNGMNELDYFHFYDMIGEFFAEKNIAAILLPTPMNLNRRIKEDNEFNTLVKSIGYKDYIVTPAHRAMCNNEMIYYFSFLKSFQELDLLIDKIKFDYNIEPQNFTNESKAFAENERKNDFEFYRQFFGGSNTKISVLGYSLGGLRALSFFLKKFKPIKDDLLLGDLTLVKRISDFLAENQSISNCITFNSAPDLTRVNLDEIKIDRSDWIKSLATFYFKLAKYQNDLKSKPNLASIDSEIPTENDDLGLLELIKFFYLRGLETYKANDKHEEKKITDKLILSLDNYLAINGGQDSIMNISLVQEMLGNKQNSFIGDLEKIVKSHSNIIEQNAIIQEISKFIEESKKPLPSVNQVIVGKGNHFPSAEGEWSDVLPRVERTILDFLRTTNIKHYQKGAVIMKLLEVLDNNLEFANLLLVDCRKFFSNKHIELAHELIKNDIERTEFFKYYHISKAYYPNFHDVIKEFVRYIKDSKKMKPFPNLSDFVISKKIDLS